MPDDLELAHLYDLDVNDAMEYAYEWADRNVYHGDRRPGFYSPVSRELLDAILPFSTAHYLLNTVR